MSGRYKRHVPFHHQTTLSTHHVGRLNWFIGAAEQPAVPRDPQLDEVTRVREELEKFAKPRPANPIAPPSDKDAEAVPSKSRR